MEHMEQVEQVEQVEHIILYLYKIIFHCLEHMQKPANPYITRPEHMRNRWNTCGTHGTEKPGFGCSGTRAEHFLKSMCSVTQKKGPFTGPQWFAV